MKSVLPLILIFLYVVGVIIAHVQFTEFYRDSLRGPAFERNSRPLRRGELLGISGASVLWPLLLVVVPTFALLTRVYLYFKTR